MEARVEKIKMLVRINKGRALLPSLHDGLAASLGSSAYSVSFASLTKTDAIKTAFRSSYKNCVNGRNPCYRAFFNAPSEALVFEMMTQFANTMEGHRVWLLLTKYAEYCGAISVDARALFSSSRQMLAFDEDSLCVISEDEEQGLLLDYSADDSQETFELAVWGATWPHSFLAYVPTTPHQNLPLD